MLTIVETDVDPGITRRTTLAAFTGDNLEDPDTCAVVAALRPGESATLGGGACPTVRVTRDPFSVRMMPGQEPYTSSELELLHMLVEDAARAEVLELEEPDTLRVDRWRAEFLRDAYREAYLLERQAEAACARAPRGTPERRAARRVCSGRARTSRTIVKALKLLTGRSW